MSDRSRATTAPDGPGDSTSLGALLDSLPDATVHCDASGRVLAANAAAQQLGAGVGDRVGDRIELGQRRLFELSLLSCLQDGVGTVRAVQLDWLDREASWRRAEIAVARCGDGGPGTVLIRLRIGDGDESVAATTRTLQRSILDLARVAGDATPRPAELAKAVAGALCLRGCALFVRAEGATGWSTAAAWGLAASDLETVRARAPRSASGEELARTFSGHLGERYARDIDESPALAHWVGLSSAGGGQQRGMLLVSDAQTLDPLLSTVIRRSLEQLSASVVSQSWRSAPDHAASEPDSRARPAVVVEDDDDVRVLICRLLEREGFEVHTACAELAAARSALRELEDRPALLVVDLGLRSGEDVLELARDALDRTSELRLLICSGRLTRDALAMRQAGRVEALAKPFLPKDLAGAVKRLFAASAHAGL